jgi:ribonuclease G
VEQEFQRALGRRVELACGGYLVIDQAEAMTVVDVNTGSFVGRETLEATLLQANLEAAEALAHQLRLRNLGGIIVVDFIDMGPAENRRRLESALESALRRDPVPTTMLGMTELGLVQITRKRTGQSLAQSQCEHCPLCEGSGVVKSARTVCYDILREIMRMCRGSASGDELQLLAAPLVVEQMQCEESASLAQVEAGAGVKIHLRAEPSFSREHFDIQLLQTP